MRGKRVSIQEPSSSRDDGERSSLLLHSPDDDSGDELFNRMKQDSQSSQRGSEDDSSSHNNRRRDEMLKADRLSMRLLQVDDDDSDEEFEILRQSLDLSVDPGAGRGRRQGRSMLENMQLASKQAAMQRFCTMVGLCVLVFAAIAVSLYVGVEFIGPPNQPVGAYELTERQEGNEFFAFYNFYDGPDSIGSNGFNTYVSQSRATDIGIINVTMEKDVLDVYYEEQDSDKGGSLQEEPFLYVSSAPTKSGKRESIRLEGKQRYNRGLFIIDVRHMPAGCGVWPAFWLTGKFSLVESRLLVRYCMCQIMLVSLTTLIL